MNIPLRINRNSRQTRIQGAGRALLRGGLLALGTMILCGSGIARADATHLDFFIQGQEDPFVVKTSDLARLSFGEDNTLQLHTGEVGNVTSSFSPASVTRIEFSNAPISPVSVKGVKGEESLRVFPNPAVESFRVSGAQGAELELLSVSGACLLKISGYTGESINISDLPAGIYLLKAGKFTTKLIKK